jgi:hypothetical protein
MIAALFEDFLNSNGLSENADALREVERSIGVSCYYRFNVISRIHDLTKSADAREFTEPVPGDPGCEWRYVSGELRQKAAEAAKVYHHCDQLQRECDNKIWELVSGYLGPHGENVTENEFQEIYYLAPRFSQSHMRMTDTAHGRLVAAETSEERNSDTADGGARNEKPSVLEQIREAKKASSDVRKQRKIQCKNEIEL